MLWLTYVVNYKEKVKDYPVAALFRTIEKMVPKDIIMEELFHSLPPENLLVSCG